MTDKPETQVEKFEKMAEALECDEDEAAFEDRVRKLAARPEASRSVVSDNKS